MTGPREFPGGRRIPGIFDGRIVVGVDTINEVYAVHIGSVCVTNICVVEEKCLVVAIVGGLDEGTELAVDLASVKDACVLEHHVVVRL